MKTVKTVMIGVGNISGIYLKNIHETFHEIELIGVCDLVRERAEKAQREYGIPKIYETMHDAFADPEVEMVLNLTRPYEHFEVSKAALEAGKHVYSEKPLGADLQEGSYVNVSFSTATTQQGIYLENPFLRTEQGKSYVYVRGEDGKLEQRFVTTGKALWGSYTEVLDGLTPEDYIAFPYGKNVVVGADTVEGDNSDLYG